MTAFRTALKLDPRSTDRQKTDPRLLRLAERLRRAAANPDLPAPEVFDPNVYPSANLVAAYFDAPSPGSGQERRYEEACLKSSPEADSLLAELFCCSEILSIWQEKPVRAPKSCRQRLYAIPDDLEPSEQQDSLASLPVEETAFSDDLSYISADEEPTPAPYPLFYSETSEKSDEKEERSADEPPVQVHSTVKKIGKALESLLLTLLIFCLLVWLVPIAKEHFEKKSHQTAETTAGPSAPLREPASEPNRVRTDAQPDKGAEFALTAPSAPSAPSLSTEPNSSNISTAPMTVKDGSDAAGTADKLSLNPVVKPPRRAALSIPPRNNDIFRQ